MALPKINVPTISVTVPSTKEVLSMRPFLVREEKILLLALHSNEGDQMSDAVKQIINNCTIMPENYNVSKLTTFDIEWLFLKLRSDSIGENVTVKFRGLENTECPECKKEKEILVSLENAEVRTHKDHTKIIKLDDDIAIHMKYPSLGFLRDIERAKEKDNIEILFQIFWSCIDCITQGDDVTWAKDVSLKDGTQWLEQLSNKQFAKLEKFFETMPQVVLDVPVKCSVCDFEETYTLRGLSDFFA